MINSTISVQDLRLKSFSIWEDQWFLLTCGDFESHHFNSMTISWGSIGVMWNKPFVQVVVRPTRYTFEFMQKYPDFTVCAFPQPYHKALQLLGARSGRDGDKIAKAKISPCKGLVTSSPAFMEANLVFECRKMYADVFRPQQFIDSAIERNYNNDYHNIYYGEILAVNGDRALYT
jgi:flavin reductase (DIM6/NTAB) family NADH-FMN oxidoreductase RutF